jgi:transposase, IS5 family
VIELHERLMELARERGVVQGRKMRVDTTVVETNIHYPTDSSLLGDGARVLTRTMKKVEKVAGGLKKRIRNRMRSVNKKVIAIALAGRWKGWETARRAVSGVGESNAKDCASSGGRVGGNAANFWAPASTAETIPGDSRNDGRACATGGAANQGASVSRDYPVSAQDRESFRAAHRNHSQGEGSKPNEFGKLVKVQEAENQIITHYDVFAERPDDSQLLVSAVEQHQRQFGRAPRMVAADSGFYSLKNERAIRGMGVTRVAVPSRSTKSSERRNLQRARWFRAGQRWRTGCEGRISVLKRRHGLNRCRYRGFEGMQRWVGLGVIADNIIQIGRCLTLQRAWDPNCHDAGRKRAERQKSKRASRIRRSPETNSSFRASYFATESS